MRQSKLQKAILTLNRAEMCDANRSHISDIDGRALLAVTVVYLVAMLSLPVWNLSALIWFAVYPIVTAPLAHEQYGRILLKSLYILPLVVLIGIFNPIYDREPAFAVGNVVVTRGWVSFGSIVVRGLLAFQALLLLIKVRGFGSFCASLRRVGLSGVLVTQLMMLYRYIGVLLSEAADMQASRYARGYHASGFRLKEWGRFVGQLMLRTIDRSRRIDMAMRARGFNGSFPFENAHRWNTSDTVYCAVWISVILFLRFFNFSSLFSPL